jgi:hypothetical protein
VVGQIERGVVRRLRRSGELREAVHDFGMMYVGQLIACGGKFSGVSVPDIALWSKPLVTTAAGGRPQWLGTFMGVTYG